MRALVFWMAVAAVFSFLSIDDVVAAPSSFGYDLPEVPKPKTPEPVKEESKKEELPTEAPAVAEPGPTEPANPQVTAPTTPAEGPTSEAPTIDPAAPVVEEKPKETPQRRTCMNGGNPNSYRCRESLFFDALLTEGALHQQDPLTPEQAATPSVLIGTWQLKTAVTVRGKVNPQPMPIGEMIWKENDIIAGNGTLTAIKDNDRPYKFGDSRTVEVYFTKANGLIHGVQCRLMKLPTPELICRWYEQAGLNEASYRLEGYITYQKLTDTTASQ